MKIDNRKNIIVSFSAALFFIAGFLPLNVIFAKDNAAISTWQVEFKKAKTLRNAGAYVEAQEILEELLNQSELSQSAFAEISAELQGTNMEGLFSRFEMPQSEIYTVVSGDFLYKIARKYKTTVELIKRSNGLSSDTIYPGMKLKIVTGVFSVHVDKSENSLKVYLSDKFLREYSVATGLNNSTPVGQFEIINKLTNPTWYRAGAVVAPDSPENILGTRWMGFDFKGYGIHGTTQPESIGTQASAGCIRMRNEEVEELYTMLPVGTKVTVVN